MAPNHPNTSSTAVTNSATTAASASEIAAANNKHNINTNTVVDHFLRHFSAIQSRYEQPGADRFEAEGKAKLVLTLRAMVDRREPIVLVLPAFPFKSPNRKIKVLGTLPDRGEELALERLENFCKTIEEVYPIGCTVTIFSDGRVFNDLLGVPESDLKAFKVELKAMARDAGHSHIRFDGLENYTSPDSKDPIREILERFGVEQMDMDARIKADEGLLNVYRSFRKFLKKDLAAHWETMSGSQADNRRGEIAKLMMHRNVGFSSLVDETYPTALRISIHLYDNAGPKYGIHLLPNTSYVPRTPWHSTICEDLDGTITAMDHASVDTTKYELVMKRGRAWGFRERPPVQQQEQQTVTTTTTSTAKSRISAETRKAWEPLHVDFIEQPLVLVIKVKADAPRQPSPLEIPGQSLRQLTCDFGVVSLQGFSQVDSQDLEKACALVGDVLYWPQWGAVFEIKTVQDTKLTGQTLERMAMHYDGMYKKKHEDSTELGDVPLFQMFHCVEAYPQPDADEATSGRTLFAHTNAILDDLMPKDRQRLRGITLKYNSGLFGYQQFSHVSPVVIQHPVTHKEVLRYHEPWGQERTKLHATTVTSLEDEADAAWVEQLLVPKLYAPEYCYSHAWTKGEYIFSDNVGLIHARTAMKADGRHVRRVHIN